MAHDHHEKRNIKRLFELNSALQAETHKITGISIKTAKTKTKTKTKVKMRTKCEDNTMATMNDAVTALTKSVADSIAAQEALLATGAGGGTSAQAQAITDATTTLNTESDKVRAAIQAIGGTPGTPGIPGVPFDSARFAALTAKKAAGTATPAELEELNANSAQGNPALLAELKAKAANGTATAAERAQLNALEAHPV